MSTDDSSKKSARPELVKLNSAFKLAEKWVSNMTRTTDNESTRVVLEARPPGLGIGAVVPRQPRVELSNDPVERKIRAQLDSGKRKFSKIEEESNPTPRDNETSDEDDETESRTKAFVKKKASSLPASLPATDKRKDVIEAAGKVCMQEEFEAEQREKKNFDYRIESGYLGPQTPCNSKTGVRSH